jgi:hypothetical protein
MKLTDFINIIRAAEHFKFEANSRDVYLMKASQLIASARPDAFWIKQEDVVIPEGYDAAFRAVRDHPLVREYMTNAPHMQWGAAFGRPIPSSLAPGTGSWSQ